MSRTKTEIENILIKNIIYPLFKNEIDSDKSSNIYSFFHIPNSGWAGNNIIENIDYYLKGWGKDNQESKLMKRIINDYNSQNQLKEQYENLIVLVYAIRSNNKILNEIITKNSLNDEFLLKNIQEIVDENIFPKHIDINILKNDEFMKKNISDEKETKVLNSLIDYLFLKKEKRKIEEQRKKEMEEQRKKEIEEQRKKEMEEQRQKEIEEQRKKEMEEQHQKEIIEEQRKKEMEEKRKIEKQKELTQLKQQLLDLFNELYNKKNNKSITTEDEITNEVVTWWVEQIICPNTRMHTGNEFLDNLFSGGILTYSKNKAQIIKKIKAFSEILTQTIKEKISNNEKVILQVDYMPMFLLMNIFDKAELEVGPGDLPEKVNMIVTKEKVTVNINGESITIWPKEKENTNKDEKKENRNIRRS